jgi:beta-lactamase class A
MNYRLIFCCALLAILGIPQPTFSAKQRNSVEAQLEQLEATTGGRLGIAAINTGNNQRISYRANNYFPMGCTSKVIGIAAILKKSMTDKQLLNETVKFKKTDLTNWNPITEKHLANGMTIKELSSAAISYSDNTAMNLLTQKLGGPAGLNAFARSINDNHFKLDHWWPDEALASPDSRDDSTTPAAMAESLNKIILGNVLADPQREMLITWLKNNVTGNARIRAGVPEDWIVGDKTGSGFHYGTTNDIAVIWPPKCKPIVITVYYSNSNKNAPKRDDVIASATRKIIDDFAQSDRCIKQQYFLAEHQVNKEPPQVVLQRFKLPETIYKNAGMSMVTFLPGSMKHRHEHTGPEVGFVLEGELILKLEGQPAQTIHAGESFQIPMHTFHTTEAGPKGAKVIATWILTN